LVVDARLTSPNYFVAADPNTVDGVEVTYLDGNDQPFLDQRVGWSVDGTEFKVRIDAGVKALHWRGLAMATGAAQGVSQGRAGTHSRRDRTMEEPAHALLPLLVRTRKERP